MRAVLGLMLWLLLPLAALAQETVLPRLATPGWVDEMPLPPDDPALRAQAQDGVHYLLADHQTAWEGDTRLVWTRTVLQVTDRIGLDFAGSIRFDYDPAFDEVALTRLVLSRPGEEIDLRDSIEALVLRREEQLDEGILDGTMTVYLRVPGLRVGDVVDYAILRRERPLLGAGERAVRSELEWQVPVVLARSVVLWPEGWPVNLAPLPDRVAHLEGPLPGGGTRHEWQRLGHVPPPAEDNVPLADDPTAILRLSAEPDWGAISAALTPHYAADYPLGAWEARIGAIAAASPDPEARAIAALRMVQDELRYVSLSMGAGGLFARRPEEVVASGFGDCKDKALLLAVMLRRLGIAADVALTDLDEGFALPREVPAIGAFDHAIVRLRLDGRVEWVDPTATHQGGDFDSAAPPDYGFALPLTGPGQVGLEEIPVTAERLWATDVTESFAFGPEGVRLEVRSEYRGGAADAMRQRWAASSQGQMSADYLGYYLPRYPGLRLAADIDLRDDRDANLLRMTERYLLPRAALEEQGLDTRFPLAAEDFAANLPERLYGPRRLPMETGAPALFHHRIELSGLPLDLLPPDGIALDNPGFSYRFAARAPGPGALVMDWSFRRSGAVVPASGVPALMADRLRVLDTTWIEWNLRP